MFECSDGKLSVALYLKAMRMLAKTCFKLCSKKSKQVEAMKWRFFACIFHFSHYYLFLRQGVGDKIGTADNALLRYLQQWRKGQKKKTCSMPKNIGWWSGQASAIFGISLAVAATVPGCHAIWDKLTPLPAVPLPQSCENTWHSLKSMQCRSSMSLMPQRNRPLCLSLLSLLFLCFAWVTWHPHQRGSSAALRWFKSTVCLWSVPFLEHQSVLDTMHHYTSFVQVR